MNNFEQVHGREYDSIDGGSIMDRLDTLMKSTDKLEKLVDTPVDELRDWKIENGLLEPADEDMVREGEPEVE